MTKLIKVMKHALEITFASLAFRLITKIIVQVEVIYRMYVLDESYDRFDLEHYQIIWNILTVVGILSYVAIKYIKTENKK